MTVNDFNNRIRFGSLYEMYGSLLTKKQQRCLELYFYEDYSLAEIADEMQVSRQAVHDLLKRVEQALEQYEKMLGFLKRTEPADVCWMRRSVCWKRRRPERAGLLVAISWAVCVKYCMN